MEFLTLYHLFLSPVLPLILFMPHLRQTLLNILLYFLNIRTIVFGVICQSFHIVGMLVGFRYHTIVVFSHLF